jgi:centromeric protein E
MESKINVTVRIKPLSKIESSQEKNKFWNHVNETMVMNRRTKESFTFDKVFGPESTTEQIFNTQVKQQVHTALSGIN